MGWTSRIRSKIELDIDTTTLESIREKERIGMKKAEPLVRSEYFAKIPDGSTGNYRKAASVETTNTGRPELLISNSSPHVHLVEFGTVERQTKSGAGRGQMPEIAPIRKTARKRSVRLGVFESVKQELKR
jgi:hypothetical protein